METYSARVAVVGCGHGSLSTIYADLIERCHSKGWTIADIDLLIICGDFQAVRNELDLKRMSVPRKYRHLGDFRKYCSQATRAPVLTLLIGGNHEASNYLFELYHGGWLAPNIYYLGATGVIRYGPWRIAGLSGIYDKKDFYKPHHERLPLIETASSHVDIARSHGWPAWVELFGDYSSLYGSKPTFLESARKDSLGSKPATQLLNHLRPSYRFSGHMHYRFPATVRHNKPTIEAVLRQSSVLEDVKARLPVFKSKYTVAASPAIAGVQHSHNEVTEFWLWVESGKNIPLTSNYSSSTIQKVVWTSSKDKYALCYDEEWLAITRAYNGSLRITDADTLIVPPINRGQSLNTAKTITDHRVWVRDHVTHNGLFEIPQNFSKHAQVYSYDVADKEEQPVEYANAQTADFAKLQQMENKFDVKLQSHDGHDEGLEIEFGFD